MRAVPSLPFSVVLLAIACLPGAVIAAGGDLGQAQKQPTNWTAILMFAAFADFPAVHHEMGGCKNQIRGRLLHRRRRHHRFSEWPGNLLFSAFPQPCIWTATTA